MDAVYTVVSLIPPGQVGTYGQVATYVVSPRHARAVGSALRHLPPSLSHRIPWQRVINANGAISHRGDVDRPRLQLELLRKEGVVFDEGGRTRLEVFGWQGPPPGWEPPFEYPFPITKRPAPI